MRGIFTVRRQSSSHLGPVRASEYKRQSTVRRVSGLLVLVGLVISTALLPLLHALPGDYHWVNPNLSGDQTEWNSIAGSADGTKLIVAAGGSLYTSNNSGASWVERTSAGTRAWSVVASSSDATKLVAAVDDTNAGGYIYTSTDSGATWVERGSAGIHNWQSIVSSPDGTILNAVAGGYSYTGYIYTSTDSGATWMEQTSAGLRNWHTVTSTADGTQLAATTYTVNGIFISTDSGLTWSEQAVTGTPSWSGWRAIVSSSDGGNLIVASPYGYLYLSTDFGSTWVELTGSGARDWSSITMSDDGSNLAATVGDGGYVYTSSDSGATWMEQTSADSHHWAAITISADGTKLAAIETLGGLYTSADSGNTWTQRTVAGLRLWEFITSSADGTKLAATTQGTPWDNEAVLYTSSNAGTTWTQHNIGFGYVVGLVGSADGTKLALIESGGAIYTSSDSGTTWVARVTTGSTDTDWTSITMSTDGITLAATSSGVDYDTNSTIGMIYTSTDSGATWTEQTATGQRQWQTITSSADGTKLAATGISYMSDEETGEIINYTNYVYTSADSGATWTEQASGSGHEWRSLTSSANGTKLAAISYEYDPITFAESYRIYTSSDSGVTWTMQKELPYTRGSITSIASSADGKKLSAAFSYDYIYNSNDSGVTWAEQSSAGMRNWRSIASSSDGTKLAATVYGGSIYLATAEGPATVTHDYTSNAAPSGVASTVTQSALSATSSTCYTITPNSTTVLGSSGLVVPQQNVTLLGGIAYNMTCATQGGSTDVTITLGTYYSDTSALRIYKKANNSNSLVDITSQVTITNTTDSSNNPITTLHYTLVDGGDYDEDGVVNGIIVDPLYIGVIQAASTTTSTGALAATGSSLWTTVFAGTSMVAAGAWLAMKRLL